MDLGLKDKVALVTAASGGLGFATAQELAREGARVIIAARSKEKLKHAAMTIESATGARVELRAADCSSAAQLEALVADTEARAGRLDILINNSAGPPSAPFLELSDDDWHGVFDAKFLPQVRCARAALPGMTRRKWGRIITFVGTHGRTPKAYAITAGVVNAALLNLTKALAQLGAPYNVLVNAINPGPIETDRMKYLTIQQAERMGISEARSKELLTQEILLNRFGEPEDIAAAAVFLASERAKFITGALFDVDGGLTRAL
jgi:NAD(P)-dependent dehydrogenase (short-subunit alcohol dehydrogenase family)